MAEKSKKIMEEDTFDSRFRKLPKIDDLYAVCNDIGKGSYGAVSKAKEKSTNEIVALKLVKRDTRLKNGFPENSIREIKILRMLKSHPNIITLRNIITCPNRDIYLVFDYCPYDLQGLIHKFGNKMGKSRVVCYFRQIIQAIYFCHCFNILHRDIKPSNIFVQIDNIIRMGDFGLARLFPELQEKGGKKDKHRKREGQPWNVVTIWYRAPELLLGAEEYGKEIDVWSLGCVLYEMITGEVLFKSAIIDGKENSQDQLRLIAEICGPLDTNVWPEVENYQFYNTLYKQGVMPSLKPVSQNLEDYLIKKIPNDYQQAISLLTGMLEINPKKRMTLKEAFLHDFMASPGGIYDPNRISALHFDEIHAMTIGEKKEANQQQAARVAAQPPVRPPNYKLQF